jgi:hypothetical protein
MVFVLGLVITLTGIALLLNLGGAGDAVIRRVTSRSLGELAPGYAASPRGFRVYAVLVTAVGVSLGAVGAIVQWPQALVLGLGTLGLGLLVFVLASVIVIVGEVRTYRGLKR